MSEPRCIVCGRSSTRLHAHHETGELETLCEYHYLLRGESSFANWELILRMRPQYDTYRKRRPRCQDMLESMMEDKGWSLGHLLAHIESNPHEYSDGLKCEARRLMSLKSAMVSVGKSPEFKRLTSVTGVGAGSIRSNVNRILDEIPEIKAQVGACEKRWIRGG